MKSLFKRQGVWCAGKLSKEVLDDVDTRLYMGLCMGLQDDIDELPESNSEEESA